MTSNTYGVGTHPADSVGWRQKQCSKLLAAARRWIVSAVTFLGSRLLNQKI